MGLFSNAKENYDRRRDIAEFNYRAREYVSEGQKIYEDAYYDLHVTCINVGIKVQEYFQYKKNILDEINRTLNKIGKEVTETGIAEKFVIPEIVPSAVSQGEKLYTFDRIIDTWTMPSVSDFFGGTSTTDYYQAKAEMQKAKAYKMELKAKREELRNAKYAVKSIPDYIYDEKSQIEELMDKFRKISSDISNLRENQNTDKLMQIAEIIAETLKTEFTDNNYQITSEYSRIHNRIGEINSSIH